MKEIKQLPTDSVWDFDQRFNTLMAKVSFQMLDVQHKEWFIMVMLPHICSPLMQQKIILQRKDFEFAMNLEALPIGETSAGMV